MAYGATIEAAIQMEVYAEDVALLDVCPFSLGIATLNREEKNKDLGDLMSKVVNKGTKLPCKKKEVFKTVNDNQKSVLFQVFEGENKYVKDNYPLGTFELTNLPPKKAGEVKMDVTFELDEDSILTVTAIEKDNTSNTNSIVIKNDKGGLSRNEIEEAKMKQENETIGSGSDEPEISIERNYKNEINQLFNKINNLTDPNEQYYNLQQLQKCIEAFIQTFSDDIKDNYTYKQKVYYYLNYLFISYSFTFNFTNLLKAEEKSNIINKVKKYLEIFQKSGTSYGASLIKIFNENDDDIFLGFCLQIIGYYSQRGTEYYISKDKKLSKHYLEEAISLAKNYSVEDTSISSDDIRNIMNALTIIAEPEIPFPQADNFERIINLCELIDKCERSKSDITEHYAFDERQADYYANAALYLGLLERRNENRNKIYELSKKGKTILRMNYKKRQLSYCECILSHEIFNIMLKQYFNSGYMPSNEDIIIAMKNCGLYKINSEETFKRRASTIKGWLNWITGIITE